MSKQGTILIADDNKGILSALEMLLNPVFKKILTTTKPSTILQILSQEEVDIVLLDMNFTAGLNTGNEGLFWLKEIKKSLPTLPVVLFTAYADINIAVKGIQEGAADFVVKPWDNEELVRKLKGIIEHRKKRKTEREPTTNIYWGESRKMADLKSLVMKVAPTDATVLITGENGIGKGVLADEIWRLSPRKAQPMIHVDMGAIPESLFESELFGYMKGAFTDAKTDRKGKFEEADGGTLFLDEIGNLSLPLQAKLLSAIQQKTIVRIGSNTPVSVDVRLILATNRNLQEMVAKGEFREDLLYRINTIHLEMPPLREHPEDVIPLAELFIRQYANLYNRPLPQLTDEAIAKLETHCWNGNIRELQHLIERAVIINDTPLLEASLFQFTKKNFRSEASDVTTLEEMERNMIIKAIDKYSGNLSAVAAELGITRQTLYNKMKKYAL